MRRVRWRRRVQAASAAESGGWRALVAAGGVDRANARACGGGKGAGQARRAQGVAARPGPHARQGAAAARRRRRGRWADRPALHRRRRGGAAPRERRGAADDVRRGGGGRGHHVDVALAPRGCRALRLGPRAADALGRTQHATRRARRQALRRQHGARRRVRRVRRRQHARERWRQLAREGREVGQAARKGEEAAVLPAVHAQEAGG
mmetsp:Transcript_35221/g.67765  ORF Transcript_35221/g.67765 Transcript_35221/m.67765 type:complete len:207 (-) Transcript_35221:1238-1858(-)